MDGLKRIFPLVLFSLFVPAVVAAQNGREIDPYEEKVSQMLKLSEMDNIFNTVIPQLFDLVRQQIPSVPEEILNRAERKFREQANDKILEIYIPIYKEYFTLEDLDEMIEYHKSPVGQKVIKAMPRIMEKAAPAGQRWGMDIMQELMDELTAGGYIDI